MLQYWATSGEGEEQEGGDQAALQGSHTHGGHCSHLSLDLKYLDERTQKEMFKPKICLLCVFVLTGWGGGLDCGWEEGRPGSTLLDTLY